MQEKVYSVIDDLKSGKYPEDDLSQLLKNISQLTDEDSMESLFILGDALVQAGAMEEAKTIFMHIYNRVEHDDEVLAYMTDIYIADGKMDDALNLINQAPKTKTVLMSKAEVFQQLNMNDVSIRLINEAKEIEDEPILDFALAEIYYQDGDFESALRYYNSLIDQDFEKLNGVNLNLRMAELYMNQIELEESRAYFDKVDEKQYSNDDLYRRALVDYQLESYESAKKLLDKVIENEPYYINAYILLMNVHETEHELDAAKSMLENYLAEDDTNPLIYFHIGRLHFRTKDSDKAIDAFKKSIYLDQDYDDAYLMLFEILLKTERTDEIEELYPNLDTHALSGESLYLLAKIEQENENDDNALKFYQDAEKLIGESLEFYTDYYDYLTEIGHPQKTPVLEKLIQLDPDNIDWQSERERLEDEGDQL